MDVLCVWWERHIAVSWVSLPTRWGQSAFAKMTTTVWWFSRGGFADFWLFRKKDSWSTVQICWSVVPTKDHVHATRNEVELIDIVACRFPSKNTACVFPVASCPSWKSAPSCTCVTMMVDGVGLLAGGFPSPSLQEESNRMTLQKCIILGEAFAGQKTWKKGSGNHENGVGFSALLFPNPRKWYYLTYMFQMGFSRQSLAGEPAISQDQPSNLKQSLCWNINWDKPAPLEMYKTL